MDENEISYEAEERETYFNYVELYDDKGNLYQIGDPYVMRYDGKYYLYSSLTGSNVTNGIPCWKSDNLVDWTFAAWVYGDGTSGSGGEITHTAYAPEVIFYNGYFYMCEAPQGKGHYILRSDAPDGKFSVCSDNLGLGIDGSLYVDREGKLYLMSAVSGSTALGTVYYTPLTVENGWVTAGFKKVISSAVLGGWTEGPGQFERNGYKYLTYTGNHVDSAAYRVGYSYTTSDSLFKDLQTVENNVILLSTGDDNPYEGGGYGSGENYAPVSTYRGLGHSSNVYGPNLDSVYIAYHNAGRYDHKAVNGSGFNRRYNVSQLLTNGPALSVNGLCTYDTPKPAGADYSVYGADALVAEDGVLLSATETQSVYTAEINVALTENKASVIVSRKSASDYTQITVDGTSLTLERVEGGTSTVLASATVALSENGNAIHTIKAINGYASCEVWYDGVKKISLSRSLGGAGKIGVKTYAAVGSVQYTNDAFGTSDFEAVKNLTATFPAYDYLKTEHRGWSIADAVVSSDGVRQGEKESTKRVNGETATVLKAGDWVKYAVNAPAAGTYAFNVAVSPESKGCVFEVIVDDEHIFKMEIGDAKFGEGYLTVNAGTFTVGSAGIHSLKVRVYSGTLDMTEISTQSGAESVETFTNELSESFAQGELVLGSVSYAQGMKTKTDDAHTLVRFGGKGLSNYEFSVDVTVLSGTAGIVFRMKNFSYTPAEKYSESHAFQGYYLQMNATAVTLLKYNYSLEQLAIASPLADGERAFAAGRTNTVTVRVVQNTITILLNGTELFAITDETPFIDGYCGLYTQGSVVVWKNISFRQL